MNLLGFSHQTGVRLAEVAFLLILIAFAAARSPAAAGVRPADQKLAERYTLELSDFPSGWKADSPPSTRLGKTPCATVPKVEGRITGYSDSAGFMPVDAQTDKRSAGSTTRVFASVAATTTWYAWAGGELSACDLKTAVASWKKYRPGFTVSRVRHAPEAFPLRCAFCPAHQLSAWRWGFTVSKQGQNDTTYVFDWVGVLIGRAVVSFSFYSVDLPFGAEAARLVAKVLLR